MTKNSSFDLPTFLPYCLNQAAESVGIGFQSIYKQRYGITRPEWRVLVHLGQFGILTATEISERAKMHKTKISRAVYGLEKRRWLIRRQDQQDRRLEHLELTKTGLGFLDLGKAGVEHDQRLLAGISDAEEAVLRSVLRKLADRSAGG